MVKRDYPDQPVIGVGVTVLGPPGIVLIRRGNPPRKGTWSLPGGVQQLGETVEECACREVLEETGLRVSLIGLIDVVNSIQTDRNEQVQYHYTLIEFAATVDGGDLRSGGDAEDARWFSPTEIDDLGLWSETRRIIDLAKETFDTLSVP